MGKDLKGKELGKGISQESTGLYSARFVDRFGKRKHKRFKKLQECRAWIADATYVDEHSDISMPSDMLVDQWFDYWIGIKKKTVRSNTVRNYTERYIKNIKPVIGKMTLSDVKPLQCQKIFYDMADQGIAHLQFIRQELHYTICLSMQKRMKSCVAIPVKNL